MTLEGGPLTMYKCTYNPFKRPYKLGIGAKTLLTRVITRFITGWGPPCRCWKDCDEITRHIVSIMIVYDSKCGSTISLNPLK